MLALRVVVGLLFIGHGSFKLSNPATARLFESLAWRRGRLMACAAGAAETAGGALLLLGFLTPLGAAMVIGVMVTAIAVVHWPKGVWNAGGGYELNLAYIASAFAIASAGPGSFSVDETLGPSLSGPGWAVGALLLGVAASAFTLSLREPVSLVEPASAEQRAA